MTLDVDIPEPPEPTDIDPNQYEDAEIIGDTDYRRDEIKELLQAGAWRDSFEEWAASADLTEDEWTIVEDLNMIEQFDFFWDDFADRVGYHAPGIPEDWKERNLHPELTSWETVSGINAGLTELGQIVCDVLKEEYIDWEASYDAPDDLPDFE
ncbi:hypothetical protein [Natronocalculus amylovorans]|uniref:DUF7992 domain-containing protein n=1 Tax=Natronocalculus amylovorans TaxID=2917812 RepID=A0AAE3FX11_9EURY|nr:hypothetical protein [Natronocalculus amylovorans]MCL9816909.1 hypothetical protein [Natronocalculus amylovorans]